MFSTKLCIAFISAYVTMLHLDGFVLPATKETFAYQPGDTHKYEYVTTTSMNEPLGPNLGKEVTYRVAAQLEVTSVWQQHLDNLILVQLLSPKVQILPREDSSGDYKDHVSMLDELEKSFLLVHMKSGKIHNFYSVKESTTCVNLKKGIASLFQYQTDFANDVEEVDVSGKCNVTYSKSKEHTIKIKNGCHFDDNTAFHPNTVLGTTLTSEYETQYNLVGKTNVIFNVLSKEKHIFRTASFPDSGATVISHQKLNLVDQYDGSKFVLKDKSLKNALKSIGKVVGVEFGADVVTATAASADAANLNYTSTINDALNDLNEENAAKLSQASAFLDLVKLFRSLKKADIVSILKNKKNKDVLPQLLDVAAAAQTPDANIAALQYLDFKSKSLDDAERFLIALSVSPHPSLEVIDFLLKIVKRGIGNEKLLYTVVHAIAAMTNTIVKKNDYSDNKTLKAVEELILESFDKCTDDECKLAYLRSLRNAGLPQTCTFLVDVVKKGGKSALEAIKAVKAMPKSLLTPEVKLELERVFFQRKLQYDSSSRIAAAEILLVNDPSADLLADMLLIPKEKSENEVNTYILNKMKELSDKDLTFRSTLVKALSNWKVGNYDIVAKDGLSTAFTQYFMRSDSLNATYSFYMEMANSGLMKKSAFDVNVALPQEDLLLLSFGLYAAGMGSMSGGSAESESESESEDATAGLDMIIMGVAFRPYVFFVGQGELMSLVWSGAGSDPTTILQGNLILHDHKQKVALQNGFVVDLTALGALSLNAKGSIQISLWNRNSHSVIADRLALLVQTSAKIDTHVIHCQVATTVASEALLEFTSDLEFYEAPFKMCTQMSQAPFQTKRLVKKYERIRGTKHALRRTKRVYSDIAGKTFVLNDKISRQCSEMFKQQ